MWSQQDPFPHPTSASPVLMAGAGGLLCLWEGHCWETQAVAEGKGTVGSASLSTTTRYWPKRLGIVLELCGAPFVSGTMSRLQYLPRLHPQQKPGRLSASRAPPRLQYPPNCQLTPKSQSLPIRPYKAGVLDLLTTDPQGIAQYVTIPP